MNKAKRNECTSPPPCCAVPIMGNHTDAPVGKLLLRTDIASDLAQVSYELGTGYSIIPTIHVADGKATLASVRIQHNPGADRMANEKGEKE
jgi:hypothetical protein